VVTGIDIGADVHIAVDSDMHNIIDGYVSLKRSNKISHSP